MATSPSFNWPEPDNTDLVKNGALAIRTAVDAIDTSMTDLRGGTTGQILSKATNTDMDFTWITNDVGDITAVTAGTGISGGGTSGAVTITNSMATEITAKGDLIVGTGSATFDNLAAGANGSTLVTDSAATTGLRYQSAYNANGIINGAFDIAQRGTSINTAAATFAYTLDRLWVYSNGPAVTTSQQATGDTTNLPNIQYCARLQRQSGQTATSPTVWYNTLETKDSIRFAGQTVTVSFYARKSATYTASLGVNLYSGTGTDQSGLGALTGQATVANLSVPVTTTWARYQLTGTVGATATQVAININSNTWVGTAGASDYVEITGLQLELGSIATTFKRAGGGTIQQELAACQRYYYRNTPGSGVQSTGMAGFAQSSTIAIGLFLPPVVMRTTPSSIDFSNVNFYNYANTAYAMSALALNVQTAYGLGFYGTIAGATAGHTGQILLNSGYIGFSAEL